jgi:hypothetical protein
MEHMPGQEHQQHPVHGPVPRLNAAKILTAVPS